MVCEIVLVSLEVSTITVDDTNPNILARVLDGVLDSAEQDTPIFPNGDSEILASQELSTEEIKFLEEKVKDEGFYYKEVLYYYESSVSSWDPSRKKYVYTICVT